MDRISNADRIPMERKQIRHRALRSWMSQKISLELVHSLLVHISCSVSVDPTFVLQQWGNTRHAGTFCDESGCMHCGLRRLLRWSFFLAPKATVALEIAAGGDSSVTGMVTFCFNESSEYWQFGESEVHIWLICVQLSLI